MSRFAPDQPLADMQIEAGSRGSLDVIQQGTQAQGLSDQLKNMIESHASDGFVLTPTLMPGIFEQFVRAVEPVLQARGLFWRDDPGKTLREHLRDR